MPSVPSRRTMPRMIVGAILVAMFVTAGIRLFSRPAPEPVRVSFLAMGTMGEISIAGVSRDTATKAARAGIARIEELEAKCSAFRPDSLVSRLGRGEEVPLPDDIRELLALTLRVCEASDGAFDPTVAPLLRLWGFRGGALRTAPPSDAEIADALAHCGWRRIHLLDDGAGGARARCDGGVSLDLGGIAKGFAVDAAFETVRGAVPDARGILVNLGGNLRADGTPRAGADAWRVAVRDPFRPYGRGSVETLPLADGLATATSGDYEQFVEIDGERFPHILDPRTGRPVRGIAQATIIAPTAAVADALSTTCFVLGPEASKPLLAAFPGVSALFVLEDGKTIVLGEFPR